MLKNRLSLTTLAFAAAIAGCTSVPPSVTPSTNKPADKPAAQAQQQSDITISEGGEIVEKDEEIELTQEESKKRVVQQAAAVATFNYDIKYVSQVPPVTVENATVQANDMVICKCGTAAFIAYNTAGDKFAGAIQIIDTTDKAKPKVTREIKFGSMDVNALYYDGDFLYFGGQADPDKWGYKSYVGRVNLSNPTSDQIMGSLVALPSHAVTSITKYNDKFYVGVGAKDGGVQTLDATMKKTAFAAFPDVRSVDYSASGVVALTGTVDNSATAGKVVTLGQPTLDITLPNFQSAYAKATLEVDSLGYAHVGLSKDGYQVINPASKNVKFRLANPSTNPLEATNGVSTDEDLAFVANGEYGFRVVQIKDRTQTDANFGAVAGFHQMKGPSYDGKSYSANLIRYKAGTLFVASGLGGVNMYTLTKK
jgi:hypothetical protein